MPEGWRPATFLERGIAIPFTTPIIAQARCRPDERGQFELIVPNPSGGDGNYIMPLAAIGNFCTPTLHDQFLIENLETIEHITPASIRLIACDAAQQGFAGRLAAKAARKRAEEDQTNMMLNYLILFVHVLREAGYPKPDWQGFDVNDPKVRALAKTCLNRYAPTIGLEAEKLLGEIEAISQVVAFVGLGNDGVASPADKRLAQMKKFTMSLSRWHQAGADGGRMPELIVDAANLTIEKVVASVQQCRRVSNDVPKMLNAWFVRRDKLREMFGIADWMLDGWQHICALWESVEDHERAAQMSALNAIAELVPLQPAEVDKWLGADGRAGQISNSLADRRVRLNEDWRTGSIRVNSREHQEKLRAYA